MKTSISLLSSLLGISETKTRRVITEMTRCGLVDKTVSREGTNIELTGKAQALLSSGFQALYKESLHIPQQCRADALLILGRVVLNS